MVQLLWLLLGLIVDGCTIVPDTDIDAADYLNRPAANAAACCNLCTQDPACGAAAFNGHNGGTCWLKYCGNDCKTVARVGVTAIRVRVPDPLPIPPDPCNPPLAAPPELAKDELSAATFNIQTQEATPWNPRKCPARKVITALGFPAFLGVQEMDVDMLKDIVGYGGHQVYFTLNGEFKGPVRPYLPEFQAKMDFCRLKVGPCNVWGVYDNCQGPGIQENQGFMLLYRNSSNLKVLQAGRFQFTVQEGCPRSEVVRNYEFGVFQIGGSKKVVVYANHLAWPQAGLTNTAQSKDLYLHAQANYRGTADRPWYIGQPSPFQLNVAGLPFIIIGDLNSFQNEGKWNLPDIQIDETAQWDWIINRGLQKRSSKKVSAQGATDHAYALVATYNFAW